MKTMKFYTIFRHPDLFHTTARKLKLGDVRYHGKMRPS